MSKHLNLILLVIAIGLGGWTYYLYNDDNHSDLTALIKKEGEAEYIGNRIRTEVYNLQGLPQYLATAVEIKHFENTEITEFYQPLLELFNEERSFRQWKVVADYAELSKEKILDLKGNVIIESLDPTSKLQRIETDQLSLDLHTQDIATQSQVTSYGQGFHSTGIGLTGNLKRQVAELVQDVKMSIIPTLIQTRDKSNSQ